MEIEIVVRVKDGKEVKEFELHPLASSLYIIDDKSWLLGNMDTKFLDHAPSMTKAIRKAIEILESGDLDRVYLLSVSFDSFALMPKQEGEL